MCLYYLRNICVYYPSCVNVFVLPQECLCLLPQFRDCVCITSGVCLFLLPQLRDCVSVTSVMCLCLLPQFRECVCITSGLFVFINPAA